MGIINAVSFIGCALMGHSWYHAKRTPNYDYYECAECEMRRKEPR